MQFLKTTFFIFIILFFYEKGGYAITSSSEELYTNGQIYTVNPRNPWSEAMLIKDGLIMGIGTTREVRALASKNARGINLNNKMVMPGIHDVHLHPLEAASYNFQFVLDDAETDPENYAPIIKRAILQNPNAEWILGWGFYLYTVLDAARSPIKILDDISTKKPIVIMEQTSHAIWANSKALQMAGINKKSPHPIGGIILKDKDGFPNGLLLDNAGNLMMDKAISSIPNSEQNDYYGLVHVALPKLAKNGITSICDARTYWKRNHHLTWQRVKNEGKLTVRVNLGLWVYPTKNDAFQIAALKSLYSNDPDSFLKINQIKLYADGIVLNTTAAMQEDYLLNILKLRTNRGLNYISQNRIAKYISALEPVGFDFHIHAIGNRGVHQSLNAIEKAGKKSDAANGRHRITHVEYVLPSDYKRFRQMNVTADAQVANDFTQPSRWHENDEWIEADLNSDTIPIKSLFLAKARITLSSDWDVSDLNPFVGLQNAVTRSPQELALSEAIKSYTIHSAYVMRQEDKVGSLAIGKEADFIILSQNLFDIPLNQIHKTKVLRTYLQGKLIYEDKKPL